MKLDKNKILYTHTKTYTVGLGKNYAPDIWLLTEKVDLRAVDCVDPIKYKVYESLNSNASHQLSELYRIRSLNHDYDILMTEWSSGS